jgi:kynureninase
MTAAVDTHRDLALSLDAVDELGMLRSRFNFPQSRHGLPPVYLCGHSLGLQPKEAVRYVQQELDDWARLGVEGHFHARRPWLPYHRFATAGLCELTGAATGEVVAMNSLTVNLHLLMASFYRPSPSRYKILIESTAFPSDRFAAASQIRLRGFDPAEALLEWTPRAADQALHVDDLQQILDGSGEQIALVLLPGVQYYNGQLLDMKDLCARARASGCRIGLDLAHAIGNVPLALHEWAPDFAAWCSYKYLNGGPGAVAGAFVHAQHLDGNAPTQLLGWWGHAEETRFRMAATFDGARGAELWQLSNPPILSLAPVLASLEVFQEAGIDRLRQKSLRLTAYLRQLLEQRLRDTITTITPMHARGSQLSLSVTGTGLAPREVFQSLERQDVFADWREPNVIRVATAPLYNTFADVFDFVERLDAAVKGRRPAPRRSAV